MPERAVPDSTRLFGSVAARCNLGFAAVCCLFAGHLILAAVFIPPWQNPDEPYHFAVVRTLARRPSIDLTNRRDLRVEAEVLKSMAQHGWWEAYREPLPDPFPTNFNQVPAHLSGSADSPALYYILASRLCRVLGVDGLLSQYYALRVVSLLTSILTFWVILRAAWDWFNPDVAVWTGAIVALVPQFALIAVAVSPDPLVFLAGAVVWWQAARLVAGKNVVRSLAVMSAATLVAVMAKLVAAPLAAQTGLLIVLAGIGLAARSRSHVLWTAFGVAVALAIALAAVALMGRPGELASFWDSLVRAFLERQESAVALDFTYFLRFTWMLFTTAYLAAGWLRFVGPAWIYVLAAGILLVALARGGYRFLIADPRIRLGGLVAVLVVAVQLGALYGTRYYFPESGTQGRYLYVVVGPIAALCAVGLMPGRISPVGMAAGLGAIGLMLMLNAAAWTTTVIPAYAR